MGVSCLRGATCFDSFAVKPKGNHTFRGSSTKSHTRVMVVVGKHFTFLLLVV